MALRRRWWLMAPLFVCRFVAFGVAHYTRYDLTDRSHTFEEKRRLKRRNNRTENGSPTIRFFHAKSPILEGSEFDD